MPSLAPDIAMRLAGLPVVKHRAQEVVLIAGSMTGGLLFLKSDAVEGRCTDRQRVGARRGVRRTGCAPGPASHGRELWNNLSSMSPTGRRYSPAIRPLPSTSPQSLRDVSILATDRL